MNVRAEKILDIDDSLNDAAKVKLSEFFMHWLSLMETQNDIKSYLVDYTNKKQSDDKKPTEQRDTTEKKLDTNEARKMPIRKDAPSTTQEPKKIEPAPQLKVKKIHRSPIRQEKRQIASKKNEAPSATYADIPQFFFPKPVSKGKSITQIQQSYIQKLERVFATIGGDGMTNHQLREHVTTKVFKLTLFISSTLFKRIDQKKTGRVTLSMIKHYFLEEMCKGLEYIPEGKEAILKLFYFNIFRQRSKAYIVPDDFQNFLSDMLLYHSGLDFLKETPPFQDKYRQCVIARIFYNVGKFVSPSQDKLTQNQFTRSNLVDRIKFITDQSDINMELEYFSYEHFYVLYCKFWALDQDHDFLISRADLSSYGNYSLTSKILDRVFAGYGRRRRRPNMMSFDEFVWFMLSEEDKTTPSAIEYWFRCLDTDEDGVLSMYEMESFYNEQLERINRQINRQGEGEQITFDNAYRQFCDIVNPKCSTAIRLSDLKRKSAVAYFLFDMLFNLNKMLEFDGKHPPSQNISKWAQFARFEYDYMAAKDDEEQQYQMNEYQNGIQYNGY